MQSTVTQETRRSRFCRVSCDVFGLLLGLLFLTAGLFLLRGTIDYVRFGGSGGRHINSAIGCAIGAVTLLFLSICLALPSKLYEDRRLRIAGQLATSMTSAAAAAAALLPVVLLILNWAMEPPSPGSSRADAGGIIMIVVMAICLAAFLVFLPNTFILAGKSRPRLVLLAMGTVVAGSVGGLLGYLCY
ncbi:MAG: hypothetical protein JW753_06985 [Dehalococcoidia bacterium]|nr:hypothetical protein [Dehalococcoidia bacterium]